LLVALAVNFFRRAHHRQQLFSIDQVRHQSALEFLPPPIGLNQVLNKVVCGSKLNCWVQVHLDFTITVYYPAAEIPRQLIHAVGVLLVYKLFGVAAKIAKNRVGFGPIYLDFVHQRKGNSKLFFDIFFNFLIWLWLLV
jgi:hypothetical protein